MGDFIGHFIINIVLNVIGGTLRWFVASVGNAIFNTPKKSYKAYLFENEDESPVEGPAGCFNIAIGGIFIAVIVIIIVNA